ncbi:MAG: hypothetical protein IJQ98_08355, partial [Oscillospiraceae bacterium]|nr:hypothetical protein [Oscillospiraceae bacterium]
MPDKLNKLRAALSARLRSKRLSTLALYLLVFLVGTLALGTLVRTLVENLDAIFSGSGWTFRPHILVEAPTWGVGFAFILMLTACYTISGGFGGAFRNGLLGGKGEGEKDRIEGSLENSRFLTDAERDKYFPTFTYETLAESCTATEGIEHTCREYQSEGQTFVALCQIII